MNWEVILTAVFAVALGVYLCYGFFQMARKFPDVVRSRDWVAIMLACAMMIVMVLGIAACVVALVTAVSGGELSSTWHEMKNWVRPVMSIALTVIVLIFIVPSCIEMVNGIRSGNTRVVLKSVVRMILILVLAVYLLWHHWSWLME